MKYKDMSCGDSWSFCMNCGKKFEPNSNVIIDREWDMVVCSVKCENILRKEFRDAESRGVDK